MLVNTFGGYSASRANSQWITAVEREIAVLVTRLLGAGLAEREGDLLHLTLLGRACGASSLSLESSLRLVELMRQVDVDATPPFQLLALVQALNEMDAVYTPVMKRGQSESKRVAEATQRFGQARVRALQSYCRESSDFWARCKRAALLYDWIEGVTVETIEARYSTTPFAGAIAYGNITGIADATRYHLRSAHRILSTLLPDKPDFLLGLDEVLVRLEFGLPAVLLPLTSLPVALTRGQYLALGAAGSRDSPAVERMDEETLLRCVGPIALRRLRPPLPDLNTNS